MSPADTFCLVIAGGCFIHAGYGFIQHRRRFKARLNHCDSLFKSGQHKEAIKAMKKLYHDIETDNV